MQREKLYNLHCEAYVNCVLFIWKYSRSNNAFLLIILFDNKLYIVKMSMYNYSVFASSYSRRIIFRYAAEHPSFLLKSLFQRKSLETLLIIFLSYRIYSQNHDRTLALHEYYKW